MNTVFSAMWVVEEVGEGYAFIYVNTKIKKKQIPKPESNQGTYQTA